MMVPRAAVCAERIERGARHRVLASCRRPTPVHRRCAGTATLELRGVEFRYPGAEEPVLQRRRPSRPGPARRPRSSASTGAGKTTLLNLVPRLFDATGGHGARRRRRRARARPRPALGRDRPGAAEAVPVLRHGRPQPALRQAGRHRRGAVARARGRPGPRLRRGDARGARRADRPGRHQRLRRPAAAAGDRPGAGPRSRRSTCSTTRSRRSTCATDAAAARGAAPDDRATRPWSSSPSGCPPSATPTRSSCSRTARSSASAPTTSCCETCATYAEIVASQLDRGGGGMSDQRHRTHAAPARPSRPPPARPGPGGGPLGGGHAGREVDELRAVGQAAAAAGCGPSGSRLIAVVAARRRSASCSTVHRPEDPRPRDRPHLRRASSASSCRPASPRTQAVDAAAGARATTSSPTCSPAMTTSCPGQGIDFDALGARCCCSCSRSTSRRRCSAGCRATCSTASCSAPCYRLRADVEEKLNRLPLSYFDGSRAASCSAGSPTTSTTSRRRLQQTLSQLLTSLLTVVGVLVMMFWISPLLALIALVTVPLSMLVTAADREAVAAAVRRAVGAHRRAQRADRGDYTGHALVKVFGRQREVEEALRASRTRSCTRPASARSSSPASSCRR